MGEKFVRVLFVGTFFMQFSLSGDKESCIRFSCCVRKTEGFESRHFFFAYAIIMCWCNVIVCVRVLLRTFSLCNSAITLLRRCIVGNLILRTFSLLYELCAVTV